VESDNPGIGCYLPKSFRGLAQLMDGIGDLHKQIYQIETPFAPSVLF
jgi:hypothetical protein